jgi:outer membrane immunogenic protein
MEKTIMKKFLFGCAMALMGISMPQAFADYCCPPPCEIANFTGLYVGGNVGVFSNTAYRNDFDDFFPLVGTRTTTHTNVTAGVVLGYDWECANKLLGIVGDWNWVNYRRREHNASDPTFIHNRLRWFTTIRARAGLTVCDALIYVTLGAAVVEQHIRWNGEPAGTGTPFVLIRDRKYRWGWASGVGVEYMLGCNWSIAGELLWLVFNEHTRRFTVGTTTFRLGHSDTAYVGRVVFNYRFGNLFGMGGGFGIL